MSYNFKVTKDADGIRLEDVSEGMLQHIPDGTFEISGHHVTGAPGYSATEDLNIALRDLSNNYIGRAGASVNLGNRGNTP